uniref:Uncharacterized protein n=1 Tax=Neogobius melanostomus TaxID=47308 RepID=A0A8C6SK43_9GOBI
MFILAVFCLFVCLFGLLFSEVVQYCQNWYTLCLSCVSEWGQSVGRAGAEGKEWQKETKFLALQVSVWRSLFGKLADKTGADNSTLNCVITRWHKGTTLRIKFDKEVIARDKALEGRQSQR